MAVYPTEKIRNIVLLGHNGSGKTSLAEAMLFNTGATTRLGRVEDGNTVSDYDEEEISRTMSINLSVVPSEWQKHKINVLDAPGFVDFQGEMLNGLHVAETAVLVLDGSAGVEVGTQLTWEMATKNQKPIAVFINKMDRSNANFQRVLDQLRDTFEATFVPLQLPIGSGESFSGVVDLLTQKSYTGEGTPGDPPADMADDIEAARLELIEYAAEGEDELMEKYFEEETLSEEDMARGLRSGLANRKIVPVFCGSATDNVAVRSFMNAIVEFFPTPAVEVTAKNTKTGEEVTLTGSANGPLVAQAFKTINDQYGRITYLRLWSGVLKSDTRVYNVQAEQEERIGTLFTPRGKEQNSVEQAVAGDIVGVVKLSHTQIGHTLCDKGTPLAVPTVEYPNPVFAVALKPKTQADSAKMGPSLARITEEDLTLRHRYEAATRETLLEGMGDVHVEIAVKRMSNRFGLGVETSTPKVPMLETITKIATAQYRHKKQTGGAGQFGEVHLRVEPMERGAGFEYKSEIFGGAISQPFLPSIEKGIKQVMEQGVIAGYPVVDVRAVVYDGKEHPVDSKDIAFQIAGREAFKLAVQAANPVLLEPIMKMTITVPEEFTGDVSGDLSTKRGRLQGMEQVRGNTIITALAPLAEVQRYATDLRSLTQGRGVFTMTLSHYEEVPSHIAQQIIAQAQKEKEEH
ncbi:MAG: elongation factor G [Chloroflexi bacterium]|nr:MAG: elongation factor G [Chloroflexota bacterium]